MTVPFLGKEFMLTWRDGTCHALFPTLDSDPVVENPQAAYYAYATAPPGGMRASDADDLFPSNRDKRFSDRSLPNGRWWSRQKSMLAIENISCNGTGIHFTVR